jgi:hypothetical protein
VIDVVATRPHYADHLLPVWDALAPGERGSFGAHRRPLDVALVAGWSDVVRARAWGARRIVRMEHGIGQSYGQGGHPSYPGGRGHADVALFLAPNAHAATRWRVQYPRIPVAIVGCPKLDTLPQRAPPGEPIVACTFHWDAQVAPETRSAFPHYRRSLPALVERFAVIGHGHPRAQAALAPEWARLGVPMVSSLPDVLARASVLVADNTSALYEAAAVGIPVVVLDAPWYRRDVNHGLRFWEAADVGVRIGDPADLVAAVERALADPPEVAAAREAALRVVYPHRTGAAILAADAVRQAFGLRAVA